MMSVRSSSRAALSITTEGKLLHKENYYIRKITTEGKLLQKVKTIVVKPAGVKVFRI